MTGSSETSTSPKKPRKKRVVSSPKEKTEWRTRALKTRWADPEQRAKLTASISAAAKRRTPENHRYRRGVPDGMNAEQADAAWAQARELGRKFIKIMEDKDEVLKVVIPGSEAEMAKAALEEAFVMAVGPLSDAKTKNTAIRTVLEWTKAKPESKSKLTVTKAEDWLAELATDMPKGDDAADAD